MLLKRNHFHYLFILLIYIFVQNSYASERPIYQVDNRNELIKILKGLKSNNQHYKVKTHKKTKIVYSVLVQDYKAYKHLRKKTNSRIVIKNKLYFIQYQSTNLKFAIKAKKLFLRKGFYSKHIRILKRNKVKTIYSVFTSNKTIEPNWLDEIETRMAQTRINTFLGKGKDFKTNYASIVSGMEFDHPKFLAKLKARGEYYQEDYDESVLELDETYITKQLGPAQLTVGKQLYSWGAFDEFSTFDRVNIKNIQRFVFDSGEAFRRPVTAIRLENYIAAFKFDAFYDFGFEPGRKIIEESRYSGYDRENGRIRSADPNLIPASLVKNLSTHYKFRENSSYGFRISFSSDFDLSLNYLKAYNDAPMVEISDVLKSEVLANTITPAGLAAGITLAYYQEEVVGIDFARTWMGQLFKMEAAMINDSPVIDENLTLQKYSKTRFSLGGDLELDSMSSTITWQVVNETILTDDKILLNKELTQYIIQTTTNFWLEKARTGMRLITNSNDSSLYLAPYLDYDYNDRLTLGLSYHYFGGEPDTFFGFNSDDKFASFKLRYLF